MSPDRMIGLLVQLKKLIEEGTIHHGAKNIKFQDNDFLFDRTRAIEFAEKIRSRGLNDYFRFQTAQSSIDTLLVDHKSGNDVDIELVRLTRACYEELGLGTDGFTANDLKWLGKDRYNMKDIFRIAEVLFGERLPQKHYAILSNHKTTVNDLLLACYNIAKIAAINYPFFKIDANIGTQSFIGTKFHSEALPLLREGKYQEPAQHHHEQSPYYHWAENKDPMSLRTMKGYLELMDKGETDLPVFLPHVYSEDVCCSTLVAQYGMIAVARGLTSLNEVSNITDILKLAQTYKGEEPLEKRRAPKIRKTAQEYLHQLANVVRRSTDSNPYVKQVMMRPR